MGYVFVIQMLIYPQYNKIRIFQCFLFVPFFTLVSMLRCKVILTLGIQFNSPSTAKSWGLSQLTLGEADCTIEKLPVHHTLTFTPMALQKDK